MNGQLRYKLALENREYLRAMHQARQGTADFAGANKAAGKGLGKFALAAGGAVAGIQVLNSAVGLVRGSFLAFAADDRLRRGLAATVGGVDAAEARIRQLRETAKAPGLGFREAVQGDIRLQAVGISAERSDRILRGFGNALATVGGGKAELDGVITALSQMQAKGKIAAEEINQIAERVPQIRKAIAEAFGSADTEALARTGLTVDTFIDGVVTQLEKLPRATGGAANSIENLEDSWDSALAALGKVWAPAIIAGLDSIATAADQFRATMERLPFGGFAEQAKALAERQAAAAAASKAQAASLAEAKASAEALARSTREEALQRQIAEAATRRQAAAAAELQSRLDAQRQATQETIFDATLSDPANIARQLQDAINNARLSIPFGNSVIPPGTIKDARTLNEVIGRLGDKLTDSQKLALFQQLQKIVELERRAKELAKQSADEAKRKADEVAREASARQAAAAGFAQENAILKARAAGNEKLAAQLERQARIEALKNQLMRDQGLTAEAALKAAQERVRLEDAASKAQANGGDAGKRRIRLKSAEESAVARFERMSEADKAKRGGTFEGFLGRDQATRLSLAKRAQEATNAAAKATGKTAPMKENAKLETLAERQQKELAAINQRLADLGLAAI